MGRRRSHANKTRTIVSTISWSVYLLSDLVATIALGKLSKVAISKKPITPMRGVWAPMTLIYLRGPDTITVLALEENSMWIKHLIVLLAQGARTAYVLYVTWTFSWYLALVLLFCGIIKYEERVWLIRSRAQWKHGENTEHPNILSRERPNTALVLQAFFNFKNLNSLNQTSAGDVFKVTEIELGFMDNMLFTKVGTIFTPPRFFYHIDFPISVVLLVGGIILEVAGVLVQLVSDRAVAWANEYKQIKLMKPVFLSNTNIVPGLKGLIIGHFRETYPAVKPQLGFTTSRGKRTLDKYKLLEELKPISELEFVESVIIWHIVTEIFCHQEDFKSNEITMTKTLSSYIVYLLHKCYYCFSSSTRSSEFKGTISAARKIFEKEKGPISSTTDAHKQLLEKMVDPPNEPNLIKMLVQSPVKDEIRENKWDILSNVWVEILCHAASGWPAEQHAQNLRQGGEFLTHVWLLLVHLGEVKLLEVDVSVKLGDIAKAASREMNICKALGTQDSSCFSGIV
ncbi:hypothetical protein NMG60_11023250 [Bertholletia excelsa]